MNVDSFRAEMECVPFHMADIFDEPDDSLWAWNKLFEDVADRHAPYKTIKVRSCSSPWMTSAIRLKINQRFKLFRKAIETKDEESWAKYKKLRNEITSDIRKAKESFFRGQIAEVRNTRDYWKILNKATRPKSRRKIGPLKRDRIRV